LIIKGLGISKHTTRNILGQRIVETLSHMGVSSAFVASSATVVRCVSYSCGGMVLLVPQQQEISDSLLREKRSLRKFHAPVFIEPLRDQAAQQARYLQRRVEKLESEKRALEERISRLESMITTQAHTPPSTHTPTRNSRRVSFALASAANSLSTHTSPPTALNTQQPTMRSVSAAPPTASPKQEVTTPQQQVVPATSGGQRSPEEKQTEKQTQKSMDETGTRGGSKVSTPIRVTEVTEGKPADIIGLQVGDEMVSIGGRKVTDAREFPQLLDRMRGRVQAGKDFTIQVRRRGKLRSLAVTPEAWSGEGLLCFFMSQRQD
jgi:type II secretory pathway component PulC